MSEELYYFKEKLVNLNRKWVILGGCILFLVFVGLGYFGVFRPVIVLDTACQKGICVKNKGGMDALIYKVDGFWYWAGQVAFLTNMPEISQRVEAGARTAKLHIPDIPVPVGHATQQGAFFMKLAVCYRVPDILIFRYTTPFYFEYDSNGKTWMPTKNIPPRYRSLGNLAMGNIGEIELNFR